MDIKTITYNANFGTFSYVDLAFSFELGGQILFAYDFHPLSS